MDFSAVIDVPALIAILGLTPVIRALLRIKERYVPLIPVVLGVVAGIVKLSQSAGGFSGEWYAVVGSILWYALLYAGGASIIYKVKRSTIMGK